MSRSSIDFSTAMESAVAPLLPARPPLGPDIGSCIRDVLAVSRTPSRRDAERRRESRYPYPYPVQITPLDARSQPIIDQTVTVLGKHLSEHGMDFYHREPIAHRLVIASLPLCERNWLALVMDLTWCRFRGQGLYDNGGRFLSVTNSPMFTLQD